LKEGIMLTKLVLENFKSIGEPGVELNLKPLTILVGPNGSGKSSILEGLALFVQSAIVTARGRDGLTGGLAFRGEYLNYPYEEEIFHKHDPQKWMAMEIHAGLGKEEKLAKLAEEVNKASLGVWAGTDTIGYRYSMRSEFFRWRAEQSIFSNGKLIITAGWEHDEAGGYSCPCFKYPPILRKRDVDRGTVNYVLEPSAFRQTHEIAAKPLNEFAETAVELIASKLITPDKKSKVFFISGLRGEIKPEEEAGKWPEWVGKHGENLVYILTRLQSPSLKHEKGREKINKWAAEFKVSKPWAGLVDANKVGSLFVDTELKISSKLALASYGSRQILTVITQLFWSEPGDIIMIEEPEISLHPESQAKLPELFAEAISEEKQIIVTTHSDFFPYALRRAIEHSLKVEDIAIYHVERDERGCTKAEPLKLDKNGYIEGKVDREGRIVERWIPSFAKVDEELSEKWFKTLEIKPLKKEG
jgi:predicted ATPase